MRSSSLETSLRSTLEPFWSHSESIELASSNPLPEALEQESRQVVVAFYEALATGDAETVQGLVASDELEWWFHGPPSNQYLMHLLTGVTTQDSFIFKPVSIVAIGNTVFVEGQGEVVCNKTSQGETKCWVHVWTVKGGKITQLREYFNTALTVLKPSGYHDLLWQSQLGNESSKSIPSFILAI